MNKFCENCGSELVNKAVFCGSCGKKTIQEKANRKINKDKKRNVDKASISILDILTFFFIWSGRINRKQFYLGNFIIFIISVLFIFIFGVMEFFPEKYEVIAGGIILLMMASSVVLGVKRLHDIGRSGWLIFWTFIFPFLFIAVFIYTVFFPSEKTTNEYGKIPLNDLLAGFNVNNT